MVKILANPSEILCFPRQGLGGKHSVTSGVAYNLAYLSLA